MSARGIFVTGTDTGAGKTLVSCAILRALSRRGLKVAAYKPVETGCRDEAGEMVGEDCERLAAAASSGQDRRDVAAYLFREPAAPLVAAEAEGATVDRAVLVSRYREIAASADFVLVESAGGLMVPIADGFTTLDLARELALPALCVIASRLGCINHALLTLEVLGSSKVPVAGYVINDLVEDPQHELALHTNRATIARFTEARDLGSLPRIPAAARDELDDLALLAERHLLLDLLLQ